MTSDEFQFDFTVDEPPAQEPPNDAPQMFDCGTFLAWQMLRTAMGKPRKRLPVGLYIVVAPSDEWCPALRQVARDVYLGGPRRAIQRRLAGAKGSEVCVFELPSTTTDKTAAQTTSAVEDELAHGNTAFVIAGSLAAVPAALQRASDRIITLPPPRRQWLAALVREIAPKTRRVHFGDLTCETVTPGSLRLAYRPGTSAHAFLRRLRALSKPEPRPVPGKAIPLHQLHGVDEAKNWARDLKADLALYRQGQIAWRELSRGLLLSGPPGTAKTTLAGSMAGFCDMGFVATSYAAWQRSGNGHLGEVLKAMAASFAEARASAPAILFIDELDTLGSRGGTSQRDDWWRSIINALLEQMDGSTSNEGVIFVAATNHPSLIDPAILRSGRLEDHIALRLPSATALAKIYADQLQGELSEAVDMLPIGRMSAGMTGADVVKICGQARRRARNAGRPLSYADLLAVIGGEGSGTDQAQRLRIATHEAGHALAAVILPELRLEHVTVVARGKIGGGTTIRPRTEGFQTPAGVDDYLTAMLAGRAAEEVVLGEISSGAGGSEGCDLSHATRVTVEAELSLGLHDQGLIWYAPPSTAQLAELFARRPDLEQTVRQRLDAAYARARELMQAKAHLIRQLAQQLLADKVMTGDAVAALVTAADGSDGDAAPLLAANASLDGRAGWITEPA